MSLTTKQKLKLLISVWLPPEWPRFTFSRIPYKRQVYYKDWEGWEATFHYGAFKTTCSGTTKSQAACRAFRRMLLYAPNATWNGLFL